MVAFLVILYGHHIVITSYSIHYTKLYEESRRFCEPVEVTVTQSSLTHAQLAWSEDGMPVSGEFGDVYFANDNGLHETRYVFLQHNGLPDRWQTHDRALFVIGETGFGTGLNFLAVWQAFRAHLAGATLGGARRLHFVSFEKFPLSRPDLARALAAWPELAPLADELLRQYPLPLPGCHRLVITSYSIHYTKLYDSVPGCQGPRRGGHRS